MEFTVRTKRTKDGNLSETKKSVGDNYNLSRFNDTFSKFYPKGFSAYAILDSKGKVLFSKGQF